MLNKITGAALAVLVAAANPVTYFNSTDLDHTTLNHTPQGNFAPEGYSALKKTVKVRNTLPPCFKDNFLSRGIHPGWDGNRFRLMDGSFATGWKKIGTNWFFFDDAGCMVTGWLNWNKNRYYLDEEGRMVTGWIHLNENEYYLVRNPEEAGNLALFSPSKNLKYSIFPETKEWKERCLSWNRQYCRFQPPIGNAAKGWLTIDGVNYCFSETGVIDENAELNRLLMSVDQAANEAGDGLSVFQGRISSASYKTLEEDIDAMAERKINVGFVLIDINSGASIVYHPKEYFFSASTIKAPYVCALASQHASGLSDYADLVEETISVSNNETYQMLRDLYGSVYMENYIRQTWTDGDIDEYGSYIDIRAKDLAKLWVANLEFFRSGDPEADWILPLFRHTRFSFIDAGIGYRYPVYSKAGWIYATDSGFNAYNDAGIVMKEGSPYLLAILSDAALILDNTLMHQFVRDLDHAHTELAESMTNQ